MKPVFVSGNPSKVAALNHWLGSELEHIAIDVDELQELDAYKVVEHKAREAYRHVQIPVLIEDTSLVFTAFGRLPGTYIKWFLKELSLEGGCRLLDGFTDKSAIAQVVYAYFDGTEVHYFSGEVEGSIPVQPRGSGGFGWDKIFVPTGTEKTYAEMNNDELARYSVRKEAVDKLKVFIDNLEA